MGETPWRYKKCRIFCVKLDKKNLHPRPWGDHVLSYTCLVEPKKRFPPWYRPEIRRALKLKQAAFERLKRHAAWLSSQGYSEYLKGLCGDFADNPKRFWSFVKCFKQSKGLSVLKHDGVQVADDIGKANLLNKTFASKFSDPAATHLPDIPFSISSTLPNFAMSEEPVCRLLQQLVVGKACGPDGLSARILRECANELAVPVSKLFQKSLRDGIFPEQWAEANIVPILRKALGAILWTIVQFLLYHFARKFSRKSSLISSISMYHLISPLINTVSFETDPVQQTWLVLSPKAGQLSRNKLSLMRYIQTFQAPSKASTTGCCCTNSNACMGSMDLPSDGSRRICKDANKEWYWTARYLTGHWQWPFC